MLKIVENLWAVGVPSRTQLGELTTLSRPQLVGRKVAAPSARTPPRLVLRSCPPPNEISCIRPRHLDIAHMKLTNYCVEIRQTFSDGFVASEQPTAQSS